MLTTCLVPFAKHAIRVGVVVEYDAGACGVLDARVDREGHRVLSERGVHL